MAWAICKKCGCPVSWPAKRGMKLKYFECPKCGGELKRCTHDEAVKQMEVHGGYYSYYVDRWISKDYYEEKEKERKELFQKILGGEFIIYEIR